MFVHRAFLKPRRMKIEICRKGTFGLNDFIHTQYWMIAITRHNQGTNIGINHKALFIVLSKASKYNFLFYSFYINIL